MLFPEQETHNKCKYDLLVSLEAVVHLEVMRVFLGSFEEVSRAFQISYMDVS